MLDALREVAWERGRLQLDMDYDLIRDMHTVRVWSTRVPRWHQRIVPITGYLISFAARKDTVGMCEVAKLIGGVCDEFWAMWHEQVTAGCYPGHDDPHPDSPAGIYAKAFG